MIMFLYIFLLPNAYCMNSLTEMGSCEEKKCFFSIIRKPDWETQERPVKSIVSTTCSNDLKRLGELTYTANPAIGKANAMELVLCRGAAICDLDFSDPNTVSKWEKVVVCEHHLSELLYDWDRVSRFREKHIYRDRSRVVCSVADGVGFKHRSGRQKKIHHLLTVRESSAVNKQYGVHLHPGIPVCDGHANAISKIVTQHKTYPRKRKLIDFGSDTNEPTCSRTPIDIGPSARKKMTQGGQALQDFANFVGVDRVCFPQKKFQDLRKTSQRKKVCAVRKMINEMVDIVAGENDPVLLKRVLTRFVDEELWTTGSSENLEKLMKQIAAQYSSSHDRKHRIAILSVVANSIPYLTVEKYIPNLSQYMYKKAKMFARRNHMKTPKKPELKLERYDETALQVFIDFITSPNIMIGLPYGWRKITLSDGKKHEIPDTIRQQSSTEIYEMYIKMMKHLGQEDSALSRSTVFRVLNICAATKRKSTTCVDYFTADGIEAFESLHDSLEKWAANLLIDSETVHELKSELNEALQYFRTDYRLHVKKCSRVADHCGTLALSDPMDISMETSCSHDTYVHKYDLKCDRCERAKAVLKEIEQLSEGFVLLATNENSPNLQEKKDELAIIGKHIEAITEMKKHYLRASITAQEREEIMQNLGDNEALITMDFAQKFLPKWHRERQTDYFGKKGINYHISNVAAKIGINYTQHSFVHIYDSEVTQNAELVVLTTLHLLKELGKVGIKTVSLRSDNAGAYHCATTINSLPWLFEQSGVTISTYTFSESQNGKSASDRDASRVKRKVESYISKGNDVTTSKQFFDALKSDKFLNGMSVYHGSVKVLKKGNSKWPGIKRLNHFTIEENGIRGRRYGGIGMGHFVQKKELHSMEGTYTFEEAGHVAANIGSVEDERKRVMSGDALFWFRSSCRQTAVTTIKRTCIAESDDHFLEAGEEFPTIEQQEIGKIYSCPEIGCSSEFLTHYNLEKHLIRGIHKTTPEKLTLRDAAFMFFSKNIEEVQSARASPLVADALNEMTETSDEKSMEKGWALPQKTIRKPFEAKVKKFLVDCFEEGLAQKRLDPKTVEKRMKTMKNADGAPHFEVDEMKNFRQIAGFFSREAEKRRSAAGNRHRRYLPPEDEAYEVPEEEHDDAGWIRFMKDEAFFMEADEIFQDVLNDLDPVFEYTQS